MVTANVCTFAHMLIICGFGTYMEKFKIQVKINKVWFFCSANRHQVDDYACDVAAAHFVKSFLNKLQATYTPFHCRLKKWHFLHICLVSLIFPFEHDNIIFFVTIFFKRPASVCLHVCWKIETYVQILTFPFTAP